MAVRLPPLKGSMLSIMASLKAGDMVNLDIRCGIQDCDRKPVEQTAKIGSCLACGEPVPGDQKMSMFMLAAVNLAGKPTIYAKLMDNACLPNGP